MLQTGKHKAVWIVAPGLQRGFQIQNVSHRNVNSVALEEVMQICGNAKRGLFTLVNMWQWASYWKLVRKEIFNIMCVNASEQETFL